MPSLNDRIKSQVKGSAPSMVPKYNPPPPKEEEIIPDIRELVDNTADLNSLTRLITESAEWAAQEKEAKRIREPITKRIKYLLGRYGVGRCVSNGLMVNYYNAPRATLSREALLSYGVSSKTLDACTVIKDSFTLRITAPGDAQDE